MRLRFGEFTLDRATRQLLQAGGERHLEPKAFELLDLLLGRRTKKEETYFALPGAGILRMSADLKQVVLVPTAPEMKGTTLHNTAIWYGPDGTAYLTFPANDAGRVFTTSLGGELLNTLASPTGDDDLGLPSVRDYFAGGGSFAPTDVAFLEGLLYVTTGYSSLDTVLTARVSSYNPLKTPAGSLPCDIDYLGRYAVIGALDGPDKKRGPDLHLRGRPPRLHGLSEGRPRPRELQA